MLWNEVEASERRKDAQLAREIELALPRELPDAENIELARDFVQEQFVARGMIADLNVHWPVDPDGVARPHAHVMLTMREGERGGVRAEGALLEWQPTFCRAGGRRWRRGSTRRLAEHGHEQRVDHRSYKERGIELEPQSKIGPAGQAGGAGGGLVQQRDGGAPGHCAAQRRADGGRPGHRAGTCSPSTFASFTRRDLARLVATGTRTGPSSSRA